MAYVNIKAAHTNGYVKLSIVRTEADAPQAVASLEAAGYWTAITAQSFEIKKTGGR